MRLYFGMGDLSATPVMMDPSIGRIDLWQTKGYYDGDSGIVSQSTPIPYREIDFMKETDTALYFYEGIPVRGVYQAVDKS